MTIASRIRAECGRASWRRGEGNLPRARLVVMELRWWVDGLESSCAEVQSEAGTAARDEMGASSTAWVVQATAATASTDTPQDSKKYFGFIRAFSGQKIYGIDGNTMRRRGK